VLLKLEPNALSSPPPVTEIEGANSVSPRIALGSESVSTAGFPVTRESLSVTSPALPSTLNHPGKASVEFQTVIAPSTVTLSFA